MNKPLKKSGKNGKPQNPFLIKYSLTFMLAVEIEQVVLPETDLTGFRAAAAAKSLQSCLTLCDPIVGSPPGSRPWDSPGKNTGVGCRFLLQCMKVKSESEVTQSCIQT